MSDEKTPTVAEELISGLQESAEDLEKVDLPEGKYRATKVRLSDKPPKWTGTGIEYDAPPTLGAGYYE